MSKESSITFVEKARRNIPGVTKEKAATRLGITPGTYRKFERHPEKISYEMALAMFEANDTFDSEIIKSGFSSFFI